MTSDHILHHEPVGNVDSWEAVGGEPCVVHIEANGRVEYLDEHDRVVRHTDAETPRAAYVDCCTATDPAVHRITIATAASR